MYMLSILLTTLLFAAPSPGVRHFRQLPSSAFPATFVKGYCNGDKWDSECSKHFPKNARIWAGDVNGDGFDELIVDDGGAPGTLGHSYELYQFRRNEWEPISCLSGNDCVSGWNTVRSRFDILPIERGGYHDLRVAVNVCLKWDGKSYVEYESADFQHLLPKWFDSPNGRDAETIWMIHYAGKPRFTLDPEWFTVQGSEFRRPPRAYMTFQVIPRIEMPRLPYEVLDDPEQNVRWVSLFRAGVWGVQGDRAFLLVPQPSYLGAQKLELSGDWLLVYGESTEEQPEIRYNRRTHEVIYVEDVAQP
jgi:hypothetical protein